MADEVAEGWQEVLARTAFIGGPQVAAFEHEYAQFIGTPHCVAVGNGTDAIEIALRALGIGNGDECILPANTFIATAEAVYRAGATPVLVDCTDDDTYLIDIDAVEAAVTAAHRGGYAGASLRSGRGGRTTGAAGAATRPPAGGGCGAVAGCPPEWDEPPGTSGTPRRPASTPARTWAHTVMRGRR